MDFSVLFFPRRVGEQLTDPTSTLRSLRPRTLIEDAGDVGLAEPHEGRPEMSGRRGPGPARSIRLRRLVAVALVGAGLLGVEMRTSWGQAALFSWWSAAMTFTVETGPAPDLLAPSAGPYSIRHGYTALPDHLAAATGRGFEITAQARSSEALRAAVNVGLFPIYPHKEQVGLTIHDRWGGELHDVKYPSRVYESYDDIPILVRETLLFIENRELLNDHFVYKNPAIEWDRFFRAVGERLVRGDEGPGGSTLATQLTKVRHSPGGRTDSPAEKVRQMISASLLAYRDGPNTLASRRSIITEYLNALPLAAAPGFGEVHGLGDGLWAWYDADFDPINRRLHGVEGEAAVSDRGSAYRMVLSLLLATRSPTRFLRTGEGRSALAGLTDRYLYLLSSGGVIPADLRDAALRASVEVRSTAPAVSTARFVDRKAAAAIRTDLLDLLGTSSLADLDRLDLNVSTTFDGPAQRAVTTMLQQLRDPAFVLEHGLVGPRTLDAGAPEDVTYSVVLYERTPSANVLRVQTDNFFGPFDVNRDSKLELGSTAKLRTLITYLQLIEGVFEVYRNRPPDEIRAARDRAGAAPLADPLTYWTLNRLLDTPDLSREALLQAAVQRTYRADPGERFFTGGGVHTFSNFDPDTAGRMTVTTAFRHSVNLVFIRMMRDVVDHIVATDPAQPGAALGNGSEPKREAALRTFAVREGAQFVRQFYRTYREAARQDRLLDAFGQRHDLPVRQFAWAYRSVFPEGRQSAFGAFLLQYGRDASRWTDASLKRLYRDTHPAPHSWQDRGYLADLHPLELWTLAYLYVHPTAELDDLLTASVSVREEVYDWLYRAGRRAQDRRIRTVLEQDAFAQIHEMWIPLGYPFPSLVPSLATAIGSSADRPAALAELMGILLQDGLRVPSIRIDSLHVAVDTPYETHLVRTVPAPEQVLTPELAGVVRQMLVDVVENGTAIRARGAVADPSGNPLGIGGKTGTGDNRIHQVYGGASRTDAVLNRTSTFVFFLGDRFYGTIVAYVPGEEARRFTFTSSLVASVLRLLGPALEDLVARTPSDPLEAVPSVPEEDRVDTVRAIAQDGRP